MGGEKKSDAGKRRAGGAVLTHEPPLPDEAAEEHGGVEVAPLPQHKRELVRPGDGGIVARVKPADKGGANEQKPMAVERAKRMSSLRDVAARQLSSRRTTMERGLAGN